MSDKGIGLGDVVGVQIVKIEGIEYTLKEFTISFELWAKKKYGSLKNFYMLSTGYNIDKPKAAQKEPDVEVVLEGVFKLLPDEARNKYKKAENLAEVIKYEDMLEIAGALYDTINHSLTEFKKKAMQIRDKQANLKK